MRTDTRRCLTGVVLFVLALALPASAQQPGPRANPNAALRYWMAFALMQDPPAEAATRNLLEAVAEGRAPWDESKLGTLLDANDEALRTMQRASALPDCDWGLEYERGPETPIAHLARARVLARLNTLAGMRAMVRGNANDAIDRWVAGLRFAQHVPRGGSLLATLTGRVMLGSTLTALTRAVEAGQVDGTERRRVQEVVRTIPETGFDWGSAHEMERLALDVWVAGLLRDPTPQQAYQRAVGAPLPGGSLPTAAAVTEFGAFMTRAATALRLSPGAAGQQLQGLELASQSLHPFYRRLIPSLSRINEARTQVKTERDRLVAALAAAPGR